MWDTASQRTRSSASTSYAASYPATRTTRTPPAGLVEARNTRLEHFAPTAWRLIAALQPKRPTTVTPTTTPTTSTEPGPTAVAVYASASRRGTRRSNCDAAAVFTSNAGTLAAALVDGTGNTPHIASVARLCAETAARVGAQRGPLAGILSASLLVADPAEEANGVAVCAVAYSDGGPVEVTWVGDCRAYGWAGTTLRRYTTDHTVGEQLRRNGAALELAAEHDNWITTSLAHAVVATVYQVQVDASLVLLTSDGVHDQVGHEAGAPTSPASATTPQRKEHSPCP
jgi:PPM family protein phosphatase